MQIFPTDPLWQHIRFRLQLILATPEIQLTRLMKYSQQFQPKYLNYMKIDCAYNATNLQQHTIEMLKDKNPSKFIFEAGHIKFTQTTSPNTSGGNRVNKILLFKIAVNDIMPINRAGLNQLESLTDFPNNVDTIYVSQRKQQLNIYPHKYRVKDKSQCCLEFEVDFVKKPLQKWNKANFLCEYCEISKAIYFCPQDREVYCGKCYEQLHRSTKKKTHEQKDLTPFNCADMCKFHGKDRQFYYCLDCMELKCERCLQNSVHKNTKKHTEIMQLPELEATLKQKQTVFLKQSKEKTKSMILKAEEALKRLNYNYEHQKRDLQQKFTLKLTRIRDESNKKVMKVMGLHSELRRRYDELLWVENFLRFCEEFMLAEDNIKMKDSFFAYLQKITTKEYFLQISKTIEESFDHN